MGQSCISRRKVERMEPSIIAKTLAEDLAPLVAKAANEGKKKIARSTRSIAKTLDEGLNPLREAIDTMIRTHKPYASDNLMRQICGSCGRSRLISDRDGGPIGSKDLEKPWHSRECKVPSLDEMLGIDRTVPQIISCEAEALATTMEPAPLF